MLEEDPPRGFCLLENMGLLGDPFARITVWIFSLFLRRLFERARRVRRRPEGCRGENFVNERSMFGKDAINVRLALPDSSRKDDPVGAGSKAMIACQCALQGFDIPRFPFKIAQGRAELFARFRSKRAAEIKNLFGQVDDGHLFKAEIGRNFIRPFS